MPVDLWRLRPGNEDFQARLHPCGHSVRIADVAKQRVLTKSLDGGTGYSCPECGGVFEGASPVFPSRDCTPTAALAWPDADLVKTQDDPDHHEQVSHLNVFHGELYTQSCAYEDPGSFVERYHVRDCALNCARHAHIQVLAANFTILDISMIWCLLAFALGVSLMEVRPVQSSICPA